MGTLNVNNINGGQLGGFRNLIINGNFQVNQRGAATRTETQNAYNYDRWYYDGTDLYQVIEGQDIRAVEHAISWSGSGLTAEWVSSANTTSSIPTGFTSITSGSTFTPTASTNLWIKFSDTLANLAEVQVEAGSTATAFEHRPYGVELALCQRYYHRIDEAVTGSSMVIAIGTFYNTNDLRLAYYFPTTMRTTPTISSSNVTNSFRFLNAGTSDYFPEVFSAGGNYRNVAQLYSGAVSGTAGNSGILVTGETGSAFVGFDAEL